MLWKQDGKPTDRWTERHKRIVCRPLLLSLCPSIHRHQIPQPLLIFNVILSHCTAFTLDVNITTPKEPQPPSPPALF